MWWSDSIEMSWGSRAAAHSAVNESQTLAQEDLATLTPEPAPQPSLTPESLAKSVPAPEAPESQRVENFKYLMNQMTSCLGINTTSTSGSDANYSNLMDVLKSDLGDPLMKSEDWSNTILQLPGGELRKIRLETDFGDEKIARRLKYFSVGKDGSQTPIEMSADQLTDPSDSLLASLESGSEVTLRESAGRTYFQNGEEITSVERNGLLSDIEIVRTTKTLKCEGMSSAEAKCGCH